MRNPAKPKPAKKSRAKKPSPDPTIPDPTIPRPIYVLSDSTANLGRHMLTAILTQFPPRAFRLEIRSFLRTPEQIDKVMAQIASAPGLVFHGMLDNAHKDLISSACKKIGVGACDLTGPFVQFISKESGLTPGQNYELLHNVDEAYHHRMQALEFTLEHDDALGMDTINEADIVLVGVSRTSKTPTSIYLAQLGYRVANIAIAIQCPIPRQLLDVREKKVVGLIIEPTVLAEIRARRQQAWRMEETSYTDKREVAKEVNWSRDLFAKQHWPILDITNQAVEETAARIIQSLGLAQPGASATSHEHLAHEGPCGRQPRRPGTIDATDHDAARAKRARFS
jgi:regulator of PEP synthase PpsR (kinase-PPPase family)